MPKEKESLYRNSSGDGHAITFSQRTLVRGSTKTKKGEEEERTKKKPIMLRKLFLPLGGETLLVFAT